MSWMSWKSAALGIVCIGAGWTGSMLLPRRTPVDPGIRHAVSAACRDVDAGDLEHLWASFDEATLASYEHAQDVLMAVCRDYSGRIARPDCDPVYLENAHAMELAHGMTLAEMERATAKQQWLHHVRRQLGEPGERPAFADGRIEGVRQNGREARVTYSLPNGMNQVFALTYSDAEWKLAGFEPYFPSRDWRREAVTAVSRASAPAGPR